MSVIVLNEMWLRSPIAKIHKVRGDAPIMRQYRGNTPIQSIVWHPLNPCTLVVGFGNGDIIKLELKETSRV